MLNMISSQFYVAKKSIYLKIIIVTLFLLFLSSALLMVCLGAIELGDVSENAAVSMPPGGFKMTGFDMFNVSLIDTSNLNFFIAIFAGLFIGGEITQRTAGMFVSSGKSRFCVVVGKFVAYLSCTALLLTISPIIMTTVLSIANGFGVEFTKDIALEMLGKIGLYFLINLSVATLFAMFAYLFKNIGVIIVITVLLNIVTSVLNLTQGFKVVDFLLQFNPLYYSFNITSLAATGDVAKAICVSVATIIISFVVSSISFKKQELK